ncbi:hypothetical protein FOA52_002173 [Chlamydomonas sp. UWO 241]|nr:hypothetical protein FOA52_002173 [Chlamydomonas sp. UWO 241]
MQARRGLKAVRLIKEADVIVYDDLGTQDALGFASEACERVYVGKRGGRASSIKQAEINKLLVDACTQAPGRTVVRLKGGDPGVFARMSSEAAALSAAGVQYEMVPGVSSALAAPLLAGVPLTDVQLGFSFAVVSGHDVPGTDWSAFSRVPTLVVLMAGKGLPGIVDALLAAGGRDRDTPVLLVRSAGLPEQRVWASMLGDILRDTQGEQLSPCVLTVGAVAQLPEVWGGLAAQAAGSDPL